MPATPFPPNYMHLGTARPLLLDVALTIPPSGDIVISVSGDISTKGWSSIPAGQKIVVTVGRGTAFESKYLVSSITFGVSSSTMTVVAADRNFDGTPPLNAPAGTTVEHTISATEMTTFTDHMRTRQAHGSDGDLVDQNSVQALSNKTFPTPTATGHPATKGYVDQAIPVGGLIAFAGAAGFDVNRWQVCDGSALSRVTYAALFAVIGIKHGAGDGSTTFNVPDLRSRFIVGSGKGSGVDSQGNAFTDRTVGLKGGAETHRLTVGEMPSHNHGGLTGNAGLHDHGGGFRTDGTRRTIEAGSDWNTGASYGNPLLPQGDHLHIIPSSGGDTAHNNLPPFYALAYLIRKA